MSEIDFLSMAEETVPAYTNEQMKMISDLAERQVKIEEYIAKCEDNLAKAKENWRRVAEVALPNAMAEVGMSEFKLSNGTMVKVKQEVYASMPEDNGAAFAWLRSHHLDGVIKNIISCQFSKGGDADAVRAAHLLAENGFHPEQKQNVHPMTLKALIREQMDKGVDVPLKDFGAYVVNRAKVELPK